MPKRKNFNDFRFAGLDYQSTSNKYWSMNRVSEDKSKIVVRVGESHLIKTRFGYALILDVKHVVFIKDWQVSENYFGNEVLLSREYWNVKEWGYHEDFEENERNLSFDTWLMAAQEQDARTSEDGYKTVPVKWKKSDSSSLMY